MHFMQAQQAEFDIWKTWKGGAKDCPLKHCSLACKESHGTHAHMQHPHNNKKIHLLIKLRFVAMAAFSSGLLD